MTPGDYATLCTMLDNPWQQWGQVALLIAAVIVIVLIILGVSTTKPWLWGWRLQ
jgi:hypothetical protein